MTNGKLPNSAFNASNWYQNFQPYEARLKTGKGWCLDKKAGKKEHLQIDMGKVVFIGNLATSILESAFTLSLEDPAMFILQFLMLQGLLVVLFTLHFAYSLHFIF